MTWGIFRTNSVSEAYKKMKAEELKGKQHKLDVDKDGKIEGEDLAKLRSQKEEVEAVEEASNPHATNDRVYSTPTGTVHRAKAGAYGGYKKDKEEVKLKSPKALDKMDKTLAKDMDEAMSKADTPTYLRKKMGDKPLTMADVKAAPKDSISHPDNLAKARGAVKEEVELEEDIMSDRHNKFNATGADNLAKEFGEHGHVSTTKKAVTVRARTHHSSFDDGSPVLKHFSDSNRHEVKKVTIPAGSKVVHDKDSGESYAHHPEHGHIQFDSDDLKTHKEELDIFSEREIDTLINEVLKASDDAGKWISDFVKSNDPRFSGDSKEQRKKRALAAYYSAQKKESVDYDSFLEDYSIEDFSLEELEEFMMSEDFDQLDELSKKTLGSYINKATKQIHKNAEPEMKAGLDGNYRKAHKHGAKLFGRSAGVDRAVNKLTKEEYDQLDELSKKTLGSYVSKAKSDVINKGHSAAEKDDDLEFRDAEHDRETAAKRVSGIKKAVNRLTKESLEEESRSEIVKSSSKEIKHANIKDKDDEKDVMQPNSEGEADFLDKHTVAVTDDPAREYKSGNDKLAISSKPIAKGPGSYNGDSKLSSKDKASVK